MRVWQAQFYFTDKDLAVYDNEDKSLPVSKRRRYYRINWREPRFFKNSPSQKWPEDISGKVPPFCNALFGVGEVGVDEHNRGALNNQVHYLPSVFSSDEFDKRHQGIGKQSTNTILTGRFK